MTHLMQLLAPYWPLFMTLVGYPVVTGLLNWYLWWDTPEHWLAFTKTHPKLAFLVRVNRAIGPHFRKVVMAWRDRTIALSQLPPAA